MSTDPLLTDPPEGKADDPEQPPLPPGTVAVLHVHARDIWAQDLPDDASLTVTGTNLSGPTTGFPVARVPLAGPASLRVSLAAADHESLAVVVRFDGSAFSVDAGPAAGRAGVVLSGNDLYLGLRHRWFSASGRPARRGNAVELLLDGEQAWARVRGELATAARTIHVSTWWWESSFELTRPAEALDPAARRPNTILSLLEASPAQKRVIVGQFLSQDGMLANMTTDEALRAHATLAGDRFEFMGQANPTVGRFLFEVEPFRFGERVRAAAPGAAFASDPLIRSDIEPRPVDLTEMPLGLEVEHASYHQKFLVLDGRVAYIGGMNLRRTDWDTSEHRVFEPRRERFESTAADRLAVAAKAELPDQGPRKDYMVRLEGPAAQDAEDVFQKRWDVLRAEGVDGSPDASAFAVGRDLSPVAGGVQVQVTTTLPEPLWEHSIAESWLNAVQNAERYIYIEDQYFRAPMLNEAILARMAAVPALRLVVVTKPIDEWTDPGCEQTYRADALFRERFPDRYLLLSLKTFESVVTWGFDETEARFVDIDTHSKMLIVDDRFLSVGSANKNNRGMVYEGEMNVAVLDEAFVRAARRRILANLLGPGVTPADDVPGFWAQLTAAAQANAAVAARWDAEGGDLDLDGAPLPAGYTPRGFVYPLAFRSPDYCFIEGVGEDMFKASPAR